MSAASGKPSHGVLRRAAGWLPRLAARLGPVLAALLVVPIALAGSTDTPHGAAPLPDGQRVPPRYLPPGALDPDPGPSDVIYPRQRITVRFNHAKHLDKAVGATCKTCHPGAYTSNSSSDRIVPGGAACDACHETDHTNVAAVKGSDRNLGRCPFCHLGYRPGDGNRVAIAQFPRANLVFPHKAHTDRTIGCPQCHGAIDELELATRDQLPRMRGCIRCHQMPDAAARGDAKGACDTCHVRGDGKASPKTGIETVFASGALSPPRWLHDAQHTPDFIERHKYVAADDSSFCANCHGEDFCTDCHDGRVRPRAIHPNDYLNMHAIDARMAAEKCAGCHREQSFCLGCHLRVGVAESSPPNARDVGRFHPPKAVWSEPPRRPGDHSFEAERNLDGCVSCHVERDCVACHGALGVGGGLDPHRPGFLGRCASQFRRNPRPCFVCHEAADGVLAQCR
jgi:Cytochrome c7 and related cytochrome c